MNLLESPWLPVITQQQNDLQYIPPWRMSEPDILALAAPRPDFNAALMQFLIGLLQTACPPEDHDQWQEWQKTPPTPEQLREIFADYQDAFELDGDGAQFMQDFEPLQGDNKPIANLLIEAPGAQTIKQNADHFIKRGAVEQLCPACAATALFTLQTNAPSGGVGHRTSLRGGGPLTTLLAVDTLATDKGEAETLKDNLWNRCWLNVLNEDELTPDDDLPEDEPALIFPWLAATRTSQGKGDITTPVDVHPLQMYWGMPRRIRLDWQNTCSGTCDICGQTSDQLVTQYITQNYGVNYEGAWQHPLSPHLKNKSGTYLPQHAQPGGMQYRHWLGLIAEYANSQPAKIVAAFHKRSASDEQLRLHAFGYDMDNMKARCWYESTFPLVELPDDIRQAFIADVATLIETATETANRTRSCIKEAWFKRPGDAGGDTQFLVEAFYANTEQAFYDHMKMLKEAQQQDAGNHATLQSWHKVLFQQAMQLFDTWACSIDFSVAEPRRIATAHQKLLNWLGSKKLKQCLHVPLKPNKQEKAA